MELRVLWKPLRRRWWLIAAPVTVVLAYVLATYQQPPPGYQVVTRYAAGTSPAVSSQDYDRYYPWLTSEYVANGLADVATTGAFAEAVVERVSGAGFQPSASAVQQAIVSDNAQSILIVYLSWPSTQQAAALAEAITDELTTNGAAYFPQLEGVEPAVRPLDNTSVVQTAAGLRAQLTGPLVRILVAVALGVALAYIWHYLDPTLYDAEEVRDLDMRLLGEIPKK